jgi:integration host factor subunit beta
MEFTRIYHPEDSIMTKSELVSFIAAKMTQIPFKDIEESVKLIIEKMVHALTEKRRIEIRGFGSFSLHYREARQGRNPKTGDQVALEGKFVPHFKPGKDMRERINQTYLEELEKDKD